MATDMDDVLSITDPEADSESFSFLPPTEVSKTIPFKYNKARGRKLGKIKSVVQVVNTATEPICTKVQSHSHTTSQARPVYTTKLIKNTPNLIYLDNLSEADIAKLKCKLGLVDSQVNNDFELRGRLVATGIVPIVKLAELLKNQISDNDTAKRLISDSISLISQVQYHLSLRRRYLIRPCLKKKYSNICNINTPITSYLFGDDISKEIRKCDTGFSMNLD
ncbi:uncharacterized protein LOC130013222 [Patella vulgata]|uniref:uncharacterized protein LOC130013222 n=1 Tax=Patella vulgata TaxID=6465 RepID=UPI0024A8114C|nr:uncharacterized protein LOC130013222 [Patella vulgata]